MEKIDRKTALKLGRKRYFTGVPCKHGHIRERLVHSGGCAECHRLLLQRQKERNPDLIRLRNRLSKQKQKARDPERVRQQWREWSARQKAKEMAAQH
jgi:hypothetical protein